MRRIELLPKTAGPARILVLGAHCDDIEIGCGGTLLRLAGSGAPLDVLWVVFCSTPVRAKEARASAAAFLSGVQGARVIVHEFKDSLLPYSGLAVKQAFEALKPEFTPDLIFTHYREDRHQDHRLVSELTWNTWRDHTILEYEIPKFDGDLGSPNVFVPASAELAAEKIRLLHESFPSQRDKHWFDDELFRALMRIRGMEAASPSGLAEAFTSRKLSLAVV
jgi:LmbE family N-acetylglucosaminyl deacetylase